VTQDLTSQGVELGGTAAYSALTACALGHPVRLVTSFPEDLQFPMCSNIEIERIPSKHATQFKNVTFDGKRTQYCYAQAEQIGTAQIPPAWKNSSIVHFGPIAQELPPETLHSFAEDAFLCATPQGWMRSWDENSRVHAVDWDWAAEALSILDAVVLSVEDVGGDEGKISELAQFSKVLAVTEANEGARVYWQGDARHFCAPQFPTVDATGAGDIFAAIFFSRLYITKDPWAAAKMAVQLASLSISRTRLASIPTRQEIDQVMVEIIN
jgi:sugar/nucleoside kinase (ribokinase family)